MMKKIICAFTLLASSVAFAGPVSGGAGAGTVPSLTVAGKVYTDLSNLIVLTAYVSVSNFATARLTSATAGYQVPTGKTLTIQSFHCWTDSTTQEQFQLGYGTNDVGLGNGAAPTGRTDLSGSASFLYQIAGGVNNSSDQAIFAQVPQNDYLFVRGAGSNDVYCIFYGYLQ